MAFKGHLGLISLENELAAWDIITKAIDDMMTKHPTTLDEDTQILELDDKDGKLG